MQSLVANEKVQDRNDECFVQSSGRVISVVQAYHQQEKSKDVETDVIESEAELLDRFWGCSQASCACGPAYRGLRGDNTSSSAIEMGQLSDGSKRG